MLDQVSRPTRPGARAAPEATAAVGAAVAPGPLLRVGLLNNMPDAALARTERQFRTLVGPDAAVELFAFRGARRGPAAEAYLDARYRPHEALAGAGLDALIVTGSEPRLPRLEDEPYFDALGAVVDWAAAENVSTLFSCLAAHAAVLHLDGIRRRPLPAKRSGVFACAAVAAHPLLDGMPSSVGVPHSRWNDLPEADLVRCGYTVLRRSDEIGVDLFVRDDRCLFVFLQGHPEYEPGSLAREFRRDLRRFLDGSSATVPGLPGNYFAPAAAARLERDIAQAEASRGLSDHPMLADPDRWELLPSPWQADAAKLFRNWLSCVAAHRPHDRTGPA